MFQNPLTCPECGAPISVERACQNDFYQLLYWENERPELGEVHHLTVLCYHLQHPSLYSPEGLHFALGLLGDFLHRGVTPEQVRARNHSQVDSAQRNWKITAQPGAQGAYPRPPRWRMNAADVVAAGSECYRENVNAWAASIAQTLQEMGLI